MILYLQKNYNGTFAITEKNDFKGGMWDCDYFTLIDNLPGDITYQSLARLVVEKFGCKKLVLDF